LTVTEPPDCPSFAAGADDVAAGEVAAAGVAPELALDETIPAGTVAEAVPSRISTWPAGTDVAAVAAAPKYLAIFAALADVPVP
jgi:NADPH-dependent curcumin reductase CurA